MQSHILLRLQRNFQKRWPFAHISTKLHCLETVANVPTQFSRKIEQLLEIARNVSSQLNMAIYLSKHFPTETGVHGNQFDWHSKQHWPLYELEFSATYDQNSNEAVKVEDTSTSLDPRRRDQNKT